MQQHIGSLLDMPRGILVHGCNAQGVMGSGLAKEVKAIFPEAFAIYRQTYETTGLRVGEVVWAATSNPDVWVANAITQEYYGRDPNRVYVDYNGLKNAFERIAEHAKKHGLPVYYPLIGCGLANGKWDRVAPIIEEALAGLEHGLCIRPGEIVPVTVPSSSNPSRVENGTSRPGRFVYKG